MVAALLQSLHSMDWWMPTADFSGSDDQFVGSAFGYMAAVGFGLFSGLFPW